MSLPYLYKLKKVKLYGEMGNVKEKQTGVWVWMVSNRNIAIGGL